MTTYELAIDEDGEPFSVPAQVAGWRARRAAEGRGRPVLVHDKGKPLVVRVNATHAELAAVAGPGRYRLEAVDEQGHKVDGVPVACTGPLVADGTLDDDTSDEMPSGSPARPVSYESVLCHMVTSQTRVMERTLSQFSAVMSGVAQLGAVMSGVAELINAAHSAGITTRVPPQPLPLPPAPEPSESDDDDDDDSEGEADEETAERKAALASPLMEMAKLIITETIDKVVPLIFEKFTGGNGAGMAPGGLPLEAIFDWRKAAPNGTPMPSGPATFAAPSAPANPAAPSAPVASSMGAESPAAAVPPVTATDLAATASSAGAAPGHDSRPGAAPAELATAPAASTPHSHEDAAALVKSHVLRVWQGLSAPERLRATQLVTALASDEREAWLAKLVRLPLPDAIALARAFLSTHPTPGTPKLPTATSHGDPS